MHLDNLLGHLQIMFTIRKDLSDVSVTFMQLTHVSCVQLFSCINGDRLDVCRHLVSFLSYCVNIRKI